VKYKQFTPADYYHGLLAVARLSANEAIGINPLVWRAHVVLGMIHCCHYEWKHAEASFEMALEIASVDTKRHIFYWAYLAATGQLAKAENLAKIYASEKSGNPQAQVLHGLYLYLSQDFVKAKALLTDVSLYHFKFAHCLLQCIYLSVPEARGTDFELTNWTPKSRFPGLDLISYCNLWAKDGFLPDQQFRFAKSELESLEKLVTSQPPLARYFDLALARLAWVKRKKAIQALRRAQKDHDPFMVWIHIWPFLDPLRQDKDFQKLIHNMKLPKS
jgi:hypothetical protein